MKLLPGLVRAHDRVIDVGGNLGVYAYQCSRLGAQLEVFEPNPKSYRVLSAWAMDKPAINVYPVALSNHSGSANLNIPIDESGVEHSASASIENTGFAQARIELVPLQTLDSYCFRDVTLIKIDVEGHEYSVIEGAAATLVSSTPALLVEIEQRHNSRPIDQVFSKILDYGYRGFFVEEGKLSMLDSFDVSRHQSMVDFNGSTADYINNFLFLHHTGLADGKYDNLRFTNGNNCSAPTSSFR